MLKSIPFKGILPSRDLVPDRAALCEGDVAAAAHIAAHCAPLWVGGSELGTDLVAPTSEDGDSIVVDAAEASVFEGLLDLLIGSRATGQQEKGDREALHGVPFVFCITSS